MPTEWCRIAAVWLINPIFYPTSELALKACPRKKSPKKTKFEVTVAPMLSSLMHTYLLPHVIADITVAASPPMNLYSSEEAKMA